MEFLIYVTISTKVFLIGDGLSELRLFFQNQHRGWVVKTWDSDCTVQATSHTSLLSTSNVAESELRSARSTKCSVDAKDQRTKK